MKTSQRVRSRKISSRLSRHFREVMKQNAPIERDLRYWVIHALHWNALLFAVMTILTVGYNLL